MIKDVALLIPVHPPFYHFIYNLLPKIQNKIDIFLVFSNEEDYTNFKEKDKIKEIILPILLYNNLNLTTKFGIVTQKKFYGLKYLSNMDYKYIIIPDSEIDIIEENFTEENVKKKIDNFFENKKIYGGLLNNNVNGYTSLVKILEKSGNVFNKDDDNIQIQKITNNYNIYYWWSDLPVYNVEHIQDFFNKINIIYDDDCWSFDNLVYNNYLLLYHDFELFNYSQELNHYLSLEYFKTNDVKKLNYLKDNNYGFSYISYLLWENNIEYLKNEGTFILFHLDRFSPVYNKIENSNNTNNNNSYYNYIGTNSFMKLRTFGIKSNEQIIPSISNQMNIPFKRKWKMF